MSGKIAVHEFYNSWQISLPSSEKQPGMTNTVSFEQDRKYFRFFLTK